GTPRLWTRADGSVSAHHTYFPFGEEAATVADGETHRFTGHERDDNPTPSIGCGTSIPNTLALEGVVYDTPVPDEKACEEISAGPAVTVAAGGDVTFRAGDRVVLEDGFTVEIGGEFVAALDAELGATDLVDLDYMHARYCSPTLGRFLSPDPRQRRSAAMKAQTWNKNAYARNNPMKFVDPNGLEEITFQLSTAINQATVLVPITFGGPKLFGGGTKTFQQVTIETDRGIAGNNPIVQQSQFVGKTQQRSLFNPKTTIRTGQAPPLSPASASFDAQGNVVLTMTVASGIPLVAGAPEINVTMTATVDPSGESFAVSASVDGFPTTAAAAVTSEGQQIPIFLVGPSGLGAFALIDGLGDREIRVQCTTADGCDSERE
ncbi:MAG: RHS repeat-associated core domain-containing protein, partial [Longimicrobiales bacterium]|nr:RHS repeat-associated core domain-containing protein [Longimicrobiales bacterium]